MRAEEGEMSICQFRQQGLFAEDGGTDGPRKVRTCWPAVSSGSRGELAVASP